MSPHPPHRWIEITAYGQTERHFLCSDCNREKTEPFDACLCVHQWVHLNLQVDECRKCGEMRVAES